MMSRNAHSIHQGARPGSEVWERGEEAPQKFRRASIALYTPPCTQRLLQRGLDGRVSYIAASCCHIRQCLASVRGREDAIPLLKRSIVCGESGELLFALVLQRADVGGDHGAGGERAEMLE